MKASDWQKTYWQDSQGNRATIHEVLADLQNEPVVSLKLDDLDHIPSVLIEEHRREVADLSFPIIVVEKDGEFQSILDGHHRRQKAIDENRQHILAKVFRGEVIDESR
jgi:hypothetical protein